MNISPRVQVGFKVNIEITCETEQEILTHLSVIRSAVLKQLRRDGGEFTKNKMFEDNNCYGYHTCSIKADIQ